ncbi:unnamed protein product [Mytilus coruscus]|uniref:Uncharacterized protein n=1 Tax=Mytilus coruscus TaxID=42192 RepID=A0A6J8BMT6_MYTCO|nr:unnamed protein product [Mytilus coruscus]
MMIILKEKIQEVKQEVKTDIQHMQSRVDTLEKTIAESKVNNKSSESHRRNKSQRRNYQRRGESGYRPCKNRKAVGIDDIPAEVWKNKVAVELLYRIISGCFELGHVPKTVDKWHYQSYSETWNERQQVSTNLSMSYPYICSMQDILYRSK